jgi:putative ABC transport system permease protein
MLYVREALQALFARRLQVFLATFGVAVGVGSMVFLVSIVTGVHRMVLEQARMRGAGLVSIAMEPPRRTLRPESPPAVLTAADAETLAYSGPAIGRTSPRRQIQNLNARLGPQQTAISLNAVNEIFLEISRLPVAYGRGLTAADLATRQRVVVLGAGIARALFGVEDPLGQTLQVGDWPFVIIGVMKWQVEPTDPERFSFADRQSYIPYTTAHETFVHPEQADAITVEIIDVEQHRDAAETVKAHLVHRHGFTETQTSWLRVYDSIERTAEMNLIMLAMKTLVGLVGSIGLFVGAVGVMNIMIVSVTQRTSEIGLRRALGARASWVRRQFLFESVLVTGIGGGAGLVGAILLTWGLRFTPIPPDFPKPQITLTTVAVAVGVIVFTGVAAGITPAIRASRITPVEALRHE